MIDRNIFIGLGGSGLNTVANLKYKIYANQTSGVPYDAMNDNYKFLFCDTDQADVQKNNEAFRASYEKGTISLIESAHEFINLGEVNPMTVYNRAKDKPWEHRIDIENTVLESLSPSMANSLRGRALSEGAGAYRLNSRIAFSLKAEEFKNRLSTKINQLLNVRGAANEQVQLRYWIVSSCNGGTGSGIFMDVLYLVNMIHKSIIPNEEPKVTLVMYMPRYYIEANNQDPKYLYNASAVFQELDSFKSMFYENDERFKQAPHTLLYRPMNLTLEGDERFSPFLSVIPIDIQTERNNHLMDSGSMYANTAELLYFVHQSKGQDPLASSFKSDADNVLEDKLLNDHLRYLMPMGYVSLRKPEEMFEQYVHCRLNVDLFTYGLLADLPGHMNRDREINLLYDQIVEEIVFKESDSPLSFTQFVRNEIATKLTEQFPKSLLLEDGKERNELPIQISETNAEGIIQAFTTVVNDVYEGGSSFDPEEQKLSKQRLLDKLEAQLWQWTEEQIIRHGLRYVKTVLDGLDTLVTQKVVAFRVGDGIGSEKALCDQIEQSKNRLPSLYSDAKTISFTEFFMRGNAPDIRAYYNELYQYIEDSGELLLRHKQFELLNELSHDDTGIIDRIRNHVGELILAAETVAKKAGERFANLARVFQRSELDITTIYLPSVSQFVTGTGWDPNNPFSLLYAKVLKPYSGKVSLYGMIPVRTQSESADDSVEAFFRNLIAVNKEWLIKHGYYIQSGQFNRSNIFGMNAMTSNLEKRMEDLSSLIPITYEQVYQSRLADEWYNKTLEHLFADLPEEKQKAIRNMLNPQLFFSYHTNEIDDSRTLNYVIAPSKEMAQNVLGYQDGALDWRLDVSQSTSVAYMLKAKIGLRISAYSMYNTLMNAYWNIEDKSMYHLHVALAQCNGSYEQLQLPIRPDKDLLLFVKYLLADKLGEKQKGLIYTPLNKAESESYSSSILQKSHSCLSFPRPEAIGQVDDCIALLSDPGKYVAYDYDPAHSFYSSVFSKFKQAIKSNYHEQALQKLLSFLAESAEVRYVYLDLKEDLSKELNAAWEQTSLKKEKEIISQMVKFLKPGGELSDYSKFIRQ